MLAGKKAIITGVTGQDGSYLAEHLLGYNCEVIGIDRNVTVQKENYNMNTLLGRGEDTLPRQQPIRLDRFRLEFGDMTNPESIEALIVEMKPDYFFNLAAQSHVGESFKQPILTTEVNYVGYLRLLETIRRHSPDTRVYQASTSEMFGTTDTSPRDETSPFHPNSPYAIAKTAAHWAGIAYRDGFDLFVANGILFNHESPRRGENFVTQKIIKAACNIFLGKQKHLHLGNLSASRDWGHAKDYVRAMLMMIQHDEPGDYVVGMGETHTVQWFLERVFAKIGLSVEEHVKIDSSFYRPNEVNVLHSNPTKIKTELGWKPAYSIDMLIEEMIERWL